MKIKYLFVSLLSTMALFSCGSDDSTETIVETEEVEEVIYELGDLGPAGGYIIYDAGNYDNGWRYIESAPEDLPEAEWGCFNSPIEDARNISVGSGYDNSVAILEYHDSFDDFYNDPSECSEMSNGTVAAKVCLDLVVGDFDDWHLPSEAEVLLMYEVLHLNGLGDFIADGLILYWSSTEHDDNTATVIDFETGDWGWFPKQVTSGLISIRAVRYF